MICADVAIPDLLRRFVPTPHETAAVIGDLKIRLQSNDIELLAAMHPAATNNTNDKGATASLLMRLIRDDEAPSDTSRLVLLSSGPLITLFVGIGTVLTLDCERREISGFVAASIPAARVVTELLPMILDFWRERL